MSSRVSAFIASRWWRREGWGDHNPITEIFRKMWIILAPVIFSLIGTNIVVEKMDGETVALGIAVIVLSMIVRCVATYFAALFGGMTTREKLFLSISWIPKATVQAALGKPTLDIFSKGAFTGFLKITFCWEISYLSSERILKF